MSISFVLIIIGLTCNVKGGDDNIATLKLVQLLYRHGDRTPVSTFPRDPYKDYWTEGLGQLTKVGMDQQYILGKYIRQRYEGFLSDTYNRADIVVRSTDLDRTLMSALCNLAGMYPPPQGQVWNPNVHWMPIPVHTVPEDEDYLFMSAPCPRYDEISQEVLKSPELEQINKRYKDLFEIMTEQTGTNISTIMDAFHIYDTLFIEKTNNLTIPEWAVQNWKSLVDTDSLSFIWELIDPEQRRLKGGPLLGQMIFNMQQQVGGKDTRKAYIYSGHDTTIAALLSAMNVYNNASPPYTAMVIVELHQIQNEYRVQVSYRNQSTASPFVLTLPGCVDICPLSTFIKLTTSVIPKDIRKECKLTGSGGDDSDNMPIIVASTIGVFISMLLITVLVFISWWMNKKNQQYRYTSVQTNN